MSYNESKTVLRAELPMLRGKNIHEAYEYFSPLLGKADYVDEWDGKVEFFRYMDSKHDYVPVEKNVSGKASDKRWGIDYILAYANDYGDKKGKANHSLRELQSIAEEMAKKFEINPEDCRIVSYTWYNGSEEPIEFEVQ